MIFFGARFGACFGAHLRSIGRGHIGRGHIGRDGRHANVKIVDQIDIANGDGVRQAAESDVRSNASAGNRLEIGGFDTVDGKRGIGRKFGRLGRSGSRTLHGCSDNRCCERMFGIAFGCGDNRQQIIGIPTPYAERQHIGKSGLASGDCAGFVKYDGVDFTARFQRFGGTDKYPHARRATGRNRH